MKNENIKLYCFTIKRPSYGFIEDETHIPVELGAALNKGEEICKVKDNTGDNISTMNPWMADATGLYWVWKNTDSDIVGTEHYRRRWTLEEKEIKKILNNYQIIVRPPVNCGGNILKQYANCNSSIDLLSVSETIINKYPSYKTDLIGFLSQNILFPNSCFIMRRKDMDEMCEFCFNILFAFFKGMNIVSKETALNHVNAWSVPILPEDHKKAGMKWQDYQILIGGFLLERLINIYIFHNFKDKIFITKNFKNLEKKD